MRRDMDLIKKILLMLEEKENLIKSTPPEIEGYTIDMVSWHFEMMHKAGLIKAVDQSSACEHRWFAKYITFDGCDVLNASRNDTIWNKAKEIIKKHGGVFSIEILKPLVIKLAKEQLKIAGYL